MDKLVEEALKKGEWKEKVDPKTNKKYYVNSITKQTTWDLANELKKAGATPSATSQDKRGPSSQSSEPKKRTLQAVLAEGEWVAKSDAATGKTYYYNKTTKKTTWDLVKDLGLDAGDTQPKATDSASASKSGEVAEISAAQVALMVEEALRLGTWQEKSDAKTGKKYYYNKATKKTVWDLAAELRQSAQLQQISTETKKADGTSTGSGSELAAGSKPEVRKRKIYDAPTLLANGEWKEVKDYLGRAFYVNPSTGEQTGDLQLYLRIQEAIDEESNFSTEPLAYTHKAGQDLLPPPSSTNSTTQVVDFDDWVSMMLHSPGHEAAVERLLKKHRFVTATEEANQKLTEELNAAKVHIAQLETRLNQFEKLNSSYRDEIHQLQCALFYGLGSSAKGYNPPMTHAVDDVRQYGALSPGRIGGSPQPASTTARSNLEQRIANLEQLLFAVQGHNRKLVADLERERESKHSCSNCSHCMGTDPWRRLLNVANPDQVYPANPFR